MICKKCVGLLYLLPSPYGYSLSQGKAAITGRAQILQKDYINKQLLHTHYTIQLHSRLCLQLYLTTSYCICKQPFQTLSISQQNLFTQTCSHLEPQKSLWPWNPTQQIKNNQFHKNQPTKNKTRNPQTSVMFIKYFKKYSMLHYASRSHLNYCRQSPELLSTEFTMWYSGNMIFFFSV